MILDMSTVWESFRVDLDVQLKQIQGQVDQSFGSILSTALSAVEVGPGAPISTKSAMLTFATVLRHRKDIALFGIEVAIEDSFDKTLSKLEVNILSPVKTAFMGMLMQNTYRAANQAFGKSLLAFLALHYPDLTLCSRKWQPPPSHSSYHRQVWLSISLRQPPQC
jgi:hypothetical protein